MANRIGNKIWKEKSRRGMSRKKILNQKKKIYFTKQEKETFVEGTELFHMFCILALPILLYLQVSNTQNYFVFSLLHFWFNSLIERGNFYGPFQMNHQQVIFRSLHKYDHWSIYWWSNSNRHDFQTCWTAAYHWGQYLWKIRLNKYCSFK